MAAVTVTWVEGLQFVGVDSTKHSVVMDARVEVGGKGSGMKPSELPLVGLGGCTGVDVVSILKKQRQDLRGLEIRVTGEQLPDPPWTFTKIHIEYIFRGRGLNEEAIKRAIRLSEEKYCSVGTTLAKAVELTHSYQIEEVTEPS